MSCPKTHLVLQEYFSDSLSALARDEIENHLTGCEDCHLELESLLMSKSHLQQWQEQQVPHWDRGVNLFRREHRVAAPVSSFWSSWQWVPTLASCAMLVILLMNVAVVSNDQGFTISFGTESTTEANLQAEIAAIQLQQREEMQELVARIDDRLDANNVRLLQAVMEQSQQTTAENFEQIYSYFEQQRLLDLQDMRVGYEELVNSDYETIRSLQQLASFVSYEGNVR